MPTGPEVLYKFVFNEKSCSEGEEIVTPEECTAAGLSIGANIRKGYEGAIIGKSWSHTPLGCFVQPSDYENKGMFAIHFRTTDGDYKGVPNSAFWSVCRIVSNPLYFLHPNRASCSDITEITTASECAEAGKHIGGQFWPGLTGPILGSWTDRPGGCFVSPASYYIHFSIYEGVDTSTYISVCKGVRYTTEPTGGPSDHPSGLPSVSTKSPTTTPTKLPTNMPTGPEVLYKFVFNEKSCSEGEEIVTPEECTAAGLSIGANIRKGYEGAIIGKSWSHTPLGCFVQPSDYENKGMFAIHFRTTDGDYKGVPNSAFWSVCRIVSNPLYFLHPNRASCSDITEITTASECAEAGKHIGGQFWPGLTGPILGSWTDRPGGCFVSPASYYIHFSIYEGVDTSTYISVCKGGPTSSPSTSSPSTYSAKKKRAWRIMSKVSKRGDALDIFKLDFYSSSDCSGDAIAPDGNPISSGHMPNLGPENAFTDKKDPWGNKSLWGGRKDPVDGYFHLGMVFESLKHVACIRLEQGPAGWYWSDRYYVQAGDAGTEWSTVSVAEDVLPGVSNLYVQRSSLVPTPAVTQTPTSLPSDIRSGSPSSYPSSLTPTKSPTTMPTKSPSTMPTKSLTTTPTGSPTTTSTKPPTTTPTKSPTTTPTKSPTTIPTKSPTTTPTKSPTTTPTKSPTTTPTKLPTTMPIAEQCTGLGRKKCERREKTCLFGIEKKDDEKSCFIKNKLFEHNCTQYATKKLCKNSDYCSYIKGVGCSHKCDSTVKKHCKNAKKGTTSVKICKFGKARNPCYKKCCPIPSAS